jgi:glyceraldehyde-3-phosphate dehydrogenase/erythrose-4-phosphate dehydrogenase
MRRTRILEDKRPPQYTDGYIEVYDIMDNAQGDFPERSIKKRSTGPVWFRQMAVFDRTRITFEQSDMEVTRKIRLPLWWEDISSNCVVKVTGGSGQEKVYNAAFVTSKAGFRETELTLINPEMPYEEVKE